jgi:hypothetical protein
MSGLFPPDRDRVRQAIQEAEEAHRRGDKRAEAVALRSMLAALLGMQGPLPELAREAAAIVSRGLDEADAELRWMQLFGMAKMGAAEERRNPAEARVWLNAFQAAAGLPTPDEEPLQRDLRAMVAASLRRIMIDTGEELVSEPDPPEDLGGIHDLTHAMDAALATAAEGDRDGALAQLRSGLAKLDPAAPDAPLLRELAGALAEEIGAASPLDARRAVLRQAELARAKVQVPGTREVVAHMRAVGYARRAGRRDVALRDGEAALRASAMPDALNMAWMVLGALAEAEEQFGRHHAALLLDKLAVREVFAQRRRLMNFDPNLATLEETTLGLLDRFVERLVVLGRLEEAEAAAALALTRAVAEQPPPPLSISEEAVGTDIGLIRSGAGVGLRNVLDAFERDARALGAAVEIRAGLHEVAPASDDATLALSYVAREGELVCIARRAGEARVLPLGLSPAAGNALAYEVRRAVMDTDIDPTEVLRDAFGRLMAAPLAALGESAARLVVGARGGLHALPWAALHDGKLHLVERLAVVRATAPGPDVLRRPVAPPRFAAFAATRAAHGLPALGAEAETEVRAAAALAPHGVAVVDGAFSEAALRAAVRGATVLLLATHFVAEPTALGRSRFLLGDGTTMSLEELARVDFSGLDLVILSACSTAGRGDTAEGAFGVDALLLAGGARAAVGTLWPVDSGAMALLVPDMIAGLAAGLDKAEALARAQRRMARGELGSGAYALPFFFAAPVICGNLLPWAPGMWSTR